MRTPRYLSAVCLVLAFPFLVWSAERPSRAEVVAALARATQYMHGTIADHGGYAWFASIDGKLKNGEGVAPPGTVWVQPPGTPAVGMAFLDAFEATGDDAHRQAAVDAARALVKGQLRSGGWNYHIDFLPAKRGAMTYRDGPRGDRASIPPHQSPGGWDVWRQRKYKGNMTLVDDDTSPAALRLLMRVDQTLGFKDPPIHEAAEYALESLRNAQYPVGAWGHNYDRFPLVPPEESHYPVCKASYPDAWSRTWTKDFTGCYMLNDRITQNVIATMLLAHRIYGDAKSLASAHRGGQFLLLAQLPEPQPAWAQQYDRHMHPVWDRKFEPPAVTGLESQDALETLLMLYRETGNADYLKPIPLALAYLRKCVLPDGKLARFQELKTNKPIYFTTDYRITYNREEMPDHYAFLIPSRLDAVDAEYRRLRDASPDERRREPTRPVVELAEAARKILASQDTRGAWLQPGAVRDAQGRKVTPKEGVVSSQTFIDNVTTLCQYLRATQGK